MRQRPTSFAAMTALAGLLAGVPAALIHLGEGLTFHQLSREVLVAWLREPLTEGFLTAVALTAGWMIWALLAVTVATRAYTGIRRVLRWLPPLYLPGPLQGLTAAMLGAVAVSVATGASAAHATPGAVEVPIGEPAPSPSAAQPARILTAATTTAEPVTVTVKRGDSLARIAKRHLGDSDRWPEIFDLNRGTHYAVGGTLTNPHRIYPGWTLTLPDQVTPPANPGPGSARPDPSDPTNPETPPEEDRQAPTTGKPSNVSPTPTRPRTPAPATPATSPGPDTCATPQTHTTSDGIALPGGSWLHAGLVAAILAAVALVWAHRRRRYIPRPPSAAPRLDDPDLAAMPDVVTQIRRQLHHRAACRADEADNTLPAKPLHDHDHDEAATSVTAETRPPALPEPLAEKWPQSGLGLTGPGADAAARGTLIAALAAGGLDNPDQRSHVIITSDTLTRLLDSIRTVADTPRLTVTDNLPDALALLEEQLLHRSRICADHDTDTLNGLRTSGAVAEPLHPMLLIADTAAAHDRARTAALLTQGHRLDIHGVLLGAWPDGITVTVADNGATSPTGGQQHPDHTDVGRLSVLHATEAAQLLTLLAESHTGQPHQPTSTTNRPPANPHPHTTAAAHSPEEPAHFGDPHETPPEQPTPPTPDTGTAIAIAIAVTIADADHPPGTPTTIASVPTDSDPHPGDNSEPHRQEPSNRVKIAVLGEPQLVDVDLSEPLRAKAMELLVYLAARDGTATQEAILEDLLPDAATSKAPHRLHTYVYNLRRVLKHIGGTTTYLSHPDRRYLLHRDALDVDLWRMRDALTDATTATDPATRIAALRRAVDTYQGPLADGKGYEWIESYREAIQRQALDAALALADALREQPAQALTVLTTAIGHHPHAEPLYQAAMRAHADLDNEAAIRDLQRTLGRRLGEIDTEPTDETLTLAHQLVTAVHRRTRRAERHPAPAGQDDQGRRPPRQHPAARTAPGARRGATR